MVIALQIGTVIVNFVAANSDIGYRSHHHQNYYNHQGHPHQVVHYLPS